MKITKKLVSFWLDLLFLICLFVNWEEHINQHVSMYREWRNAAHKFLTQQQQTTHILLCNRFKRQVVDEAQSTYESVVWGHFSFMCSQNTVHWRHSKTSSAHSNFSAQRSLCAEKINSFFFCVRLKCILWMKLWPCMYWNLGQMLPYPYFLYYNME